MAPDVHIADPAEGLSDATTRQLQFVFASLARLQLIAGLEKDGGACAPVLARQQSDRSLQDRGRKKHGQQPPLSPRFSPYYPLNMVHASEPRISAVARCLAALLTVVDLEDESGQVVRPNGFRLKSLETWTTRCLVGDAEPIEHYLATGLCNVNCDFCYEHGTPYEMRTPRFRVRRSELETRLKYYRPAEGSALFDVFHQYYDAFAHPDWYQILRAVRERTDSTLDLITNGRTLTEEAIGQIGTLRPVRLIISLNSQDPQLRAKVMKDRTPDVAAASLPLLAKARIPFGIVIVPWPPELDADELERTVRFVEPHGAMFVSVSLPGVTRYFPSAPGELNEDYHREIVKRVRALRGVVQTPLLIQPRMMEACWHNEDHNRAFVLGAMPDSSAARAGLKYGDVIEQMNDMDVVSAYHAQRFLTLLDEHGEQTLELTFRRDARRFTATLERLQSDGGLGFGLVLADGLDPAIFSDLVDETIENGDKEVWILSSKWMLESVGRYLQAADGGRGAVSRIKCIPVPNTYFGGNIDLGDLLTVQDFIDWLRTLLKDSQSRPDRIYIPKSPFTAWCRDLRGISVQALVRAIDVPISLVPNQRIMI